MSIIHFTTGTLFLVVAVSALRAPADVYSAVIRNGQGKPVQCNVIWSQLAGQTLQTGLFTVEKDQHFVTNEKTANMGTWTARASIQEIRCGKLLLTAPFNKVNSPTTKWEFLVQPDEIVSVGPSE